MTIKRMQDMDLGDRRVLLRLDLNVPMDGTRVTDDTRIVRVRPTIDHLRAAGAKIIALVHLGRPKGREDALSTRHIVPACASAWDCAVTHVPDVAGGVARDAIAAMRDGDVMLLENIRFDAREESNDAGLAAQLASLGDVYINDAFSVSHRAHVSTEYLARLLPCAAGYGMQAELDALSAALLTPARPVVAVVGGSKVSTKIGVLEHLITKVDQLVIGGGMANTFLLAQGHAIGASLAEPSLAETARAVLTAAADKGCKIILPVDVVAGHGIDDPAPISCDLGDLPQTHGIFDLGPRSRDAVRDAIGVARTIVWNGPVGVFENPHYAAGTLSLVRAIADATQGGTVTVAGGGDTIAAIESAGLRETDFTFVSTAGGAFLEWLEGRTLPGVVALLVSAHPTAQSAL